MLSNSHIGAQGLNRHTHIHQPRPPFRKLLQCDVRPSLLLHLRHQSPRHKCAKEHRQRKNQQHPSQPLRPQTGRPRSPSATLVTELHVCEEYLDNDARKFTAGSADTVTRASEASRKELRRNNKSQSVGAHVETQLAEDVEHDCNAVELRLHCDLVCRADDNEEDAEDSL